ncbi:DUF4435 domain-containing protein [Staphylococcus sp. EG-SA-13]|nr:DUF4435 domain-containing protein [Staphylococcus sp. EG-SA-13]
MDIKEKMREKYNSNQKFIHEINLQLNRTDLIYCIVEGDEDIVFYHNKLQYYNDELKPRFIVAKNKEKVIKYSEIITKNKKWKDFKSLFFIDKDYDNVKYESVFITDAYSIENYFVSSSVLEKILEYNFGINDEKIINEISNLFKNAQKEYHCLLLKINAFLKLQRLKENKYKEMKRLNLDKLKLNEFVEISLDGVIIKKNLDEFVKKVSDYYDFNDLEFNKVLNGFDSNRYIYDFRGKYEIHFFINFIERILEEINKKENRFGQKKKIPRYQNDVIKRFISYSESPKNLKSYYDLRINEDGNF